MGQCYGKSIPSASDDDAVAASSGAARSPPPATSGGAGHPPPSSKGTTPSRSSAPTSQWPSPYVHGAASPLPVGVSPSPARSTPRRFLRRPFPPPSPAKHIRAALRRRRAPKSEEGTIPEDEGDGAVVDGETERALDKNFGYGKNFAAKYEVGKEVGRGHFGYTCSARAKKGEIKGQFVAVKIISKAKGFNPQFAMDPAPPTFDADLYSSADQFHGYARSIPVTDDDHAAGGRDVVRQMASYTGPTSINDLQKNDQEDGPGFKKPQRIIDREDEYRRRGHLNRVISPDRNNPFATGDATPDPSLSTCADVTREAAANRKREETLLEISKKKKEEAEESMLKRSNRWDQSLQPPPAKISSLWDAPDSTPEIAMSETKPTPGRVTDATPTPSVLSRKKRWDETPPLVLSRKKRWDETPPLVLSRKKRWDETPPLGAWLIWMPHRLLSGREGDGTRHPYASGVQPLLDAAIFTPGVTPVGGIGVATPTPGAIKLKLEQCDLFGWERGLDESNRPLTKNLMLCCRGKGTRFSTHPLHMFRS